MMMTPFQKIVPMADGRSGWKFSNFIYWEAVIWCRTCHACIYKNMGFIGFYSKWNTKSLKFGGWFGTKPKYCEMPKPEIECRIRNTRLMLSQTILQNHYYALLFYTWTCSYESIFCGNRHHASTIHDIFGSCVINGMFISISKIVTPHFLNKIIYLNWDFWHDKFFHAFQKNL